MTHATVLVSGGAAVSPFTTPDAAAAAGLAAGNSLTALRAALLATGRTVFTAPARIGAGTVESDPGWQGFADVPTVLPAAVTINSVGTIDDAGASLAAFLKMLADGHGVSDVDLVGHSMGGLFSRAAIRIGLGGDGIPAVRRLVTLGTPWTGALLGDAVAGDITLDADGETVTAGILHEAVDFARQNSQGAAVEVSERFLVGDDGWNAAQAGVLDGIPVTLVAGGRLDHAGGDARLWPHDGLVSRRSARAELVPASVLPIREVVDRPEDVHSIFFADALGLPWDDALTWDPVVLDAVATALDAPI
jgi:pimeloyl-ACP methyl ester carboxylesterase